MQLVMEAGELAAPLPEPAESRAVFLSDVQRLTCVLKALGKADYSVAVL